jgi:UDP-N-acetylmuramoylalanine-D-glutamate ligase
MKGNKFYDLEDFFSEFDFSNNSALKNWPTPDISNIQAALLASALTIKHIEENEVHDLNNFLSKSLERMSSFNKKAHRFEMIEDEEGVLHINDSKAIIFSAIVQSIESSSKLHKEGDMYLLCGGDFKSQSIDKVKVNIFNDIKKCFIFGKDKKILEELLSDFTDCIC